MTVASPSFYDRAAAQMGALSRAADALNTQIATGKRINAPSDAPLSYARLRGLARGTADATAYGANLKVAASTLSSADTAMTSMTQALTQAQTLVTQASTGTLNADNRRAIGEQVAGLVDTLRSLAATSDPQGHPLFGDTGGGAAVTARSDGSFVYAAGTAPSVPIADGQSIDTGVTASRLFDLGSTDTLGALSRIATALRGGGTVPADSLPTIQAAVAKVATAQASVGARAARVDLEQSSQTAAATERETLRSGLEDTDVTTAITQLQKTMTTLQATQASFTKLSSLSLFDYLR